MRMPNLSGERVVPSDLDVAQMAVSCRVFRHSVAEGRRALDLVEHFERVALRAVREWRQQAHFFDVRARSTDAVEGRRRGMQWIDRDGDEAGFAERGVV